VLGKLQQIKLTYFFNVIDRDHNGFIEADDFSTFVSRLAALRGVEPGSLEYEQFHPDALARWNEVRQSADKDYNGRIGLQEWLDYWSAEMDAIADAAGESPNFALVQLKHSAHFTFDLLDRDDDEKISAEEYGHVLQAWGLDIDTGAVFQRLDLNSDGFITRDELVQLSKQFFLSNDPEVPGNYICGNPF
jgi:juvenile hormone diol kinase